MVIVGNFVKLNGLLIMKPNDGNLLMFMRYIKKLIKGQLDNDLATYREYIKGKTNEKEFHTGFIKFFKNRYGIDIYFPDKYIEKIRNVGLI